MKIDPGTFFILVGTLAAGGVAGYAASSKRMVPALDDAFGRLPNPNEARPEPPKAAVDAAAPIASVTASASAASIDAGPSEPPCDDSVGTPGDCPPPGYPTVEGGCGSFANTRCKELKESLKPRVAQAAVECLNKLKPQERCDANRVNLCGHLAVMNACPEKRKVAMPECDTIIAACGPSPVAPSMIECRQTVAALTPEGRTRLVSCMRTHCLDKGLVGCVALPEK